MLTSLSRHLESETDSHEKDDEMQSSEDEQHSRQGSSHEVDSESSVSIVTWLEMSTLAPTRYPPTIHSPCSLLWFCGSNEHITINPERRRSVYGFCQLMKRPQ